MYQQEKEEASDPFSLDNRRRGSRVEISSLNCY